MTTSLVAEHPASMVESRVHSLQPLDLHLESLETVPMDLINQISETPVPILMVLLQHALLHRHTSPANYSHRIYSAIGTRKGIEFRITHDLTRTST